MYYFDLHCHPGLKTLFLPQDGHQFSAWHTIDAPHIFGDILSSQCSLEQISRSKMPLVCITLHAPESGMINQFLIRLAAATFFRDYMSPERLREMYGGTEGYQEVFGEELSNLLKPPALSDAIPGEIKIIFLKQWSDYDPAAANTVHVLFNIEGGHNLYDNGDSLSSPGAALDNLQAFLDKGYLTLYLTPTHLTPNAFINHAYGNKILTRGPLLPQGLGITAAGKTLIEKAYARGLLIDIKHMSLVARMQFYRIRRLYYPEKPIIASHIGLTGMPVSEYLGWARFVKPMGPVVEVQTYKYQWQAAGVSFYPLSINLFTEDILEILDSGGLIGLSMDVRILGAKDDNDTLQYDYLSTAEYEILKLDIESREQKIQELTVALMAGHGPASTTQEEIPAISEFAKAVAEETAEIMPLPDGRPISRPDFEVHLRQLAATMLKVLAITRLYALPDPWDHLCIGSDFDGLVQAVDCCKTSLEFEQMAQALAVTLEAVAAKTGLELNLPASEIVAKFCYTNAFNFIDRHFDNHQG